jgi:hypothetical protein
MPFGEGVMHFERGERERSAVHQTIRVFELHGCSWRCGYLCVRDAPHLSG